MDGITLAAVAEEMKQKLISARVEKIYQPERDELLILFRGTKERLLISVNPGQARIQLTNFSRENPAQPPMFCMLLRKLLTGSKLSAINQLNFDRVLEIVFDSYDELGDPAKYSLITEIMGKHSNLILARENGRIVDSLKHVTPLISSVRTVMPGHEYTPAPGQGKRNPLEDDWQSIRDILQSAIGRIDRVIVSTWSGISPDMAKEIALRAGQPGVNCEQLDDQWKEKIAKSIAAFFDQVRDGRFEPSIVENEYREPLKYLPFPSLQYDSSMQTRYHYISEALDAFYSKRDQLSRIKQRGASLRRILQQNIERCEKKLGIQRDIIAQADNMEKDRVMGELIIANIHCIKKGDRTAVVQNYYDDAMPLIEIQLDERYSPSDNAQQYYKRYNKHKKAFDLASAQIEKIQMELNYLEGQLENLQLCSSANDLDEIRRELISVGYIRPDRSHKPGNKRQKTSQGEPLHFISSEGYDIFVGKNNAQNDTLTMQVAKSEDIWLHCKDAPGSHVIIKSRPEGVGDITLQEAAELAAYFSKLRNSSKVPIDYTQRKNIRKPNSSLPGYVIYLTNKTVYVTPDKDKLRKLEMKNSQNMHWD